MPKRISVRERILSKIDHTPDECWTWVGIIDRYGYGRLKVEGRLRQAHRVVFEEFVGPIPAGLDIDHLCRNRACVNPKHLEAVTHAENMARAFQPLTHCHKGHELAGQNLVKRAKGRGRGQCRVCHRERTRNYMRRKRAEAKATA